MVLCGDGIDLALSGKNLHYHQNQAFGRFWVDIIWFDMQIWTELQIIYPKTSMAQITWSQESLAHTWLYHQKLLKLDFKFGAVSSWQFPQNKYMNPEWGEPRSDIVLYSVMHPLQVGSTWNYSTLTNAVCFGLPLQFLFYYTTIQSVQELHSCCCLWFKLKAVERSDI